jgi:acyl-coenzyme A thioesterase PaaI-like protein
VNDDGANGRFDEATLLERSGAAYRNCFGCGRENPIGLRLVFQQVDGGAEAQFTPRPELQGWDGRLHGGIILTMLDETLAYAALFAVGPAVTAEIRARLRKPASLDQTYTLRGEVVRVRLGLIQAHASIRDPAGVVVAEADGKFMQLGRSALPSEPEAAGSRQS